jgi:hypothetical protein
MWIDGPRRLNHQFDFRLVLFVRISIIFFENGDSNKCSMLTSPFNFDKFASMSFPFLGSFNGLCQTINRIISFSRKSWSSRFRSV